MSSHSTASVPRAASAGVAAVPGLRTLRSARFRVLVAAALLIIGGLLLGLLLVQQADAPSGQFAIDFSAYHAAAARLASGSSPYEAALMKGPISAQGVGNYLYPPLLAQLLVPFAALSAGSVAVAWLLAQLAAVFGAVLIAFRAGLRAGSATSPLTLEAALWAGVATVWFLPVFDTLWKGNVSAFLALQVALLLIPARITGASASIAALLKVSPIVFMPLVFAGARRPARAAVSVGVVVLALSVLVSPAAWGDYLSVLPNLFSGDARQANNLSPWAMAGTLGAPGSIAFAMRMGSLALAVGGVLGSVVLARRPGGWHAGVVLATAAMLLLPAQLWYHYLAVLLPLAAVSWTQASPRGRAVLLVTSAAMTCGIAWLPLATCAAVALLVTTLVIVWPGEQRDPATDTQASRPPANAPAANSAAR